MSGGQSIDGRLESRDKKVIVGTIVYVITIGVLSKCIVSPLRVIAPKGRASACEQSGEPPATHAHSH